METFVVRIFIPGDDARPEFRGTVEHIGSGKGQAFDDGPSLIRLIGAWLPDAVRASGEGRSGEGASKGVL